MMNKRNCSASRRPAAVAIITALISMLTACGAPTELGDRLAVGALAVDYENDVFALSVACLDAQSGSPENVGEIGLLYFTAEGPDLDAAFEELNEQTAGRLFFGHAAGLILSKKVLSEKPGETMRYFIEDRATRLGLKVFACEGSAIELLRAKTVYKALAVGSLETLARGEKRTKAAVPSLYELGAALSCERTAYAPLLASRPVEATGHDGEVLELFIAGQFGVEQEGGLMYNKSE